MSVSTVGQGGSMGVKAADGSGGASASTAAWGETEVVLLSTASCTAGKGGSVLPCQRG